MGGPKGEKGRQSEETTQKKYRGVFNNLMEYQFRTRKGEKIDLNKVTLELIKVRRTVVNIRL